MKKLLLPTLLIFASLHGEQQTNPVDALRNMWDHRTEYEGAIRITLGELSYKANDFDELMKVEKLNISNPYVSDITPLSGLKNLKSLDLSGTFVSDISALAALENLEWLNLANTQVADISVLYGLRNLKYVDLFNSNVQEEQLKGLESVQHMRLKKDKNVIFSPTLYFMTL